MPQLRNVVLNRDVRAMAALALARAGDTAAAEKLATDLDKTLVQRYWLPTISGWDRPGTQRPESGNRTIEGAEHGRTWRNDAIHDIPVPSLFAGRRISCFTTATERQRNFRSSSPTEEWR
jgi:hypothetical protein